MTDTSDPLAEAREAIARIIDPFAFPIAALGELSPAYGFAQQKALAKADQILALVHSRGV